MLPFKAAIALAFASFLTPLLAADYPAPKQGEWIAKDFKFHTGEVMSESRRAIKPRTSSLTWQKDRV